VLGRVRQALRGGPPPDPKAYTPPELTDAQQRALDALREDGIAIVPFAELFADGSLWEELASEMEAFAAQAAHEAVRGGQGGKKDYLVRRYPRGKGKLPVEPAVLASDGPWLRYAAGDPLLDVVNTYRAVKTKLVDFDQWYTIPVGEEGERHHSQLWHRDPEDQHVVKVFLYFSDVDEDAGPFEYVRQSAEGGKYGDLWPWGETERYPPSDELEHAVDDSDRVLATGAPGTLVICDTSGFHRGGYARTKPRVLATQTYVDRKVTPENKRRKFQVDWRSDGLSAQARFALS
jgi:Phytanoyl-CoA dioxygenase (PhyH)